MPSKSSFETFQQSLCSVISSWTPRLGKAARAIPSGSPELHSLCHSLTHLKILLNICGMKECSGLGPKSRRNSCPASRGQLGVS